MHIKRNLLIWVAVFAMAMPLVFTAGTAGAVYNTDGAIHDATSGGWVLPSNYYCIATPATWTTPTSGSYVPNAVRRDDIAAPSSSPTSTFCTITITSVKNAVKYSDYPTDTVLRTKASCDSLGYNFSSYSGSCGASLWTTDSLDTRSPQTYYQGNNGCLRCHNNAYMATHNPPAPQAAKETYLFGGHKNMNRPADGKPWGIPGVDATHPADPSLVGALLDGNGFFTKLWVEEDFNTWTVNWGTGAWNSNVSYGRCVKSGRPVKSDLPDWNVCPTCETALHNGNKGYPEGYPDAATCAAAATDTGLPYSWITISNQPIYLIYGGAGLERGPGITPVNQDYNCARCHTTGWSADDKTTNHTAAHLGDRDTKKPYADFSSVNFLSTTDPSVYIDMNGAYTPVLNTGGGAPAGTIASWDQYGIQCSRCHAATDGGHATFPQTGVTKGGDIIALCINCHRQDGSTGNPASDVKQNKAAAADGFDHHPDGNEFLNSPHSRLTGSYTNVGCPPFALPYAWTGYDSSWTNPGAPSIATCNTGTMNLDGLTSSAYLSKFAQAAVADLGVSNEAAGSCVTCHDVHKSMNQNSSQSPTAGAAVACIDCHQKPIYSASTATAISPQITTVNHISGVGTPMAAGAEACNVCHQPGDIKHLWRINTSASYRLFGDYASGAKNVNYAPETFWGGTYSNAAWVDLDNACGQCHGGGLQNADVTTTVTATAAAGTSITVADASKIESGKEIQIAGAGYGPDAAHRLFKAVVASVSGNTIGLTWGTVNTVYPGAAVTVTGNATSNGAPYLSRTDLACFAKNMHDPNRVLNCTQASAAPVVGHGAVSLAGWTVSFTDSSNDPDGTIDNVIVNWGDGSTDTKPAGSAFSHAYSSARARSYNISQHVVDPVNARLTSAASTTVWRQPVPQRYSLVTNVTTTPGSNDAGTIVAVKKSGHTVAWAKMGTSSNCTAGADNQHFSCTFDNLLPGTDYTIKAYKFKVINATSSTFDVSTGSASVGP